MIVLIYRFTIRNSYNEDKEFYLTADTPSQLYKRILNTYGITKDNVSLLEEYEETSDWSYKLKKSHVKVTSTPKDKDSSKVTTLNNEVLEKAKKIFSKNSRMTEPWKSDYKERHKVREVPVSGVNDVYGLVEKYKFVKVYWEPGEKRGVHKYFALVK